MDLTGIIPTHKNLVKPDDNVIITAGVPFGNAGSTIQIKKGKFINMPECGDYNAPIIYTIPLQILAYEVACLRGTDLDQPRNLAKSVTVE